MNFCDTLIEKSFKFSKKLNLLSLMRGQAQDFGM